MKPLDAKVGILFRRKDWLAGMGWIIPVVLLGLAGCGRQEAPPPQARRQPPRPPLRERGEVPVSGVRPPRRFSPADVDAPKESHLPTYNLQMAESALERMAENPFGSETYPASFEAGGRVYDAARVRHRGAWARSWPKKPLKIFFDKGKEFDGKHCLNLSSGWRDPAFFREVLAYHTYAACGVPASTSQVVRLNVNGKFHGLFVEVEQPDKPFLQRHHLKGAAIYKASSRANQADERDHLNEARYRVHYEKQTRKEEDYSDLAEFCRELAAATNTVAFFESRLDLPEYINYLAATVLVQHWDGFNKNHFLVRNRETGKWIVVPWDLDRTFGDHWNWSFTSSDIPILLGTQGRRGVTGWSRMQDRFFRDPVLKGRLLDRLDELLKTEFTEEKLFPVVDHLAASIQAELPFDRRRWPGPGGDFHLGVEQVKEFIRQRRLFLARDLAELRRAPAGPEKVQASVSRE